MNPPRSTIFRFEIRLRDIEPPIWRMIEIPASATFWVLHVAIQDAMGWLDYHLHEFSVSLSRASGPVRIGIPDDEFRTETLPSWEEPVAFYFQAPGDRAMYWYDFGDDWRHDVTLVAIEPRVKGMKYPRCIAGDRACPPEDCGGSPGYFDMLHALADPNHPEREELLTWLGVTGPRGRPYDPEAFDPAQVRFSSAARRLRKLPAGSPISMLARRTSSTGPNSRGKCRHDLVISSGTGHGGLKRRCSSQVVIKTNKKVSPRRSGTNLYIIIRLILVNICISFQAT